MLKELKTSEEMIYIDELRALALALSLEALVESRLKTIDSTKANGRALS